jgi:undecaprenyl-diphosphatase
MDFSLLKDLNNLFARADGLEDVLTTYARVSEALFLGALIVAFVLVGRSHALATRRAVVAAGLSAGLGLAVAAVLARLVDRPRPFVTHPDVHLFVGHAADPGFPSDHTTAAFAIAVALLLRSRPWGLAVLAAATVLAIARVGMAVHYPSDVLAGAALGALAALALHAPPLRSLTDGLADRVGAMLPLRRTPAPAT